MPCFGVISKNVSISWGIEVECRYQLLRGYMNKNENKDSALLEKVEKDLVRSNEPGDSLAPISNWKDCYDLVYLTIYRLFYPNIDGKKDLSKKELDKRIAKLEEDEVDGRISK